MPPIAGPADTEINKNNEEIVFNNQHEQQPSKCKRKQTLIATTVNRKPTIICDECDRTFSYQSTLLQHKNSVHRGIRPYPCHMCSKSFFLSHHLRDHILTHTGEKPFACDQCDKAFNRSKLLSEHKIRLHQHVRAHQCTQCYKRFSLASDLKLHSITHKSTLVYYILL